MIEKEVFYNLLIAMTNYFVSIQKKYKIDKYKKLVVYKEIAKEI
ncbi:hypothetical protein JCM14036_03600 [Desulfotomaculum defluvii]